MKKRLLIFSLATLSLFSLTGCANSQSNLTTSLKNQTERVDTVVSQNIADEISSVSPPNTTNKTGSIHTHRATSFYNMTRENEIKEDISYLNNSLKDCLNKDVKLSKRKQNALKKATSNIGKNINKYNSTKNEIKNSVKVIKQSMKVPDINVVGAESEYITLNGNMGERYVYLCNIYDNLEQAYLLICDCCYDCNSQEENLPKEDLSNNTSENKASPKHSRFRKNIDSYAPAQDYKTNENLNKNNSNVYSNSKQPAQYNGSYGYNPYYNYGYNQFPNNPYGYANGYRRFNPNRNTDTFYPYNRNIDTYRGLPNYNYPVSGTPINNPEEEAVKPKNNVINLNSIEDEENIIEKTTEEIDNVLLQEKQGN